MMGRPLSLEDAKIQRHLDIEKIAGNTRWDSRDNAPSGNVFRIDHPPLPEGVFFLDPSVPSFFLCEDTISMEVPEMPTYVHRDGINYSEDAHHPLALNEYEVPDEELVAFNATMGDVLPVFKKHFYNTAANLSALDEAQNHVKAGLRDGLDIGIEIDGALLSAFVSVSRLDAISCLVEKSGMSSEHKNSYMTKISELLAEKTMEAMHRHDVGELAREQIRQYQETQQHARVRGQESSQNTMGVTGSIRR